MRKAFQIGLLSGSLIWSVDCSSAPVTPTAGPPPTPVAPTAEPQCKDIEAPTLIHRVEPEYPAYVQNQGIEGKVVAEGVLTPDGSLQDIRAISSASERLTKLAMKAFYKWRYKPAFCKDSGKPIRVYVTLTTTFKLPGRSKG